MSAPEGSGWAKAGFVVRPEETVVDLVDSKRLRWCGPVSPFRGRGWQPPIVHCGLLGGNPTGRRRGGVVMDGRIR